MLKEELLSYIDRFSAYLAEVEGKPQTTITAYIGDVRQMAVIFSENSEIADKQLQTSASQTQTHTRKNSQTTE